MGVMSNEYIALTESSILMHMYIYDHKRVIQFIVTLKNIDAREVDKFH